MKVLLLKLNFFRTFICSVLIFQCVFQCLVQRFAFANQGIQTALPHYFSSDIDAININLRGLDDLFDEDPFFLKSQKWTESVTYSDSTNRTDFNLTDKSVSLSFQKQHKTLELSAGLHFIGQTDEFVFLAEDSSAPYGSQGLFFMSVASLLEQSKDDLPVPIYFFPLPEGQWHGDVHTIRDDLTNAIVIQTEDQEVLPLKLDDVLEVYKIESLNLMMAQFDVVENKTSIAALQEKMKAVLANPVKKEQASTHGLQDFSEALQLLDRVYPKPRSTLGFGMVYIGKDAQSGEIKTSQSKSLLNSLFIESAYAEVSSLYTQMPMKGEPPHLTMQDRLTRVAFVIAVSFLASIVLKYKVYQVHFAKRKADQKFADGMKGVVQKLGFEAKSILDVYAHVLTTLNQIAPIWFGNFVEYLGDRFVPAIASNENSILRRVLQNTLYFSRDTNERVSVNWKTVVFGSFIAGGINSTLYGFQLFKLLPWIANGLSFLFPFLKPRVVDAFQLHNPNSTSFMQNEWLYCFTWNQTSGASAFSQDVKGQNRDKIQSNVAEQMRSEGLDPKLDKNQAERKRRYENQMEARMLEMGLPDRSQFLFDPQVLYEKMLEFFGISIARQVLYDLLMKDIDLEMEQQGVPVGSPEYRTLRNKKVDQALRSGELERQKDKFTAYNRPGLVIPSAQLALSHAKKLLDENPTRKQNQEVVQLLQEIVNDISYKEGLIKDPIRAIFYPDKRGERWKKIKDRFYSFRKRYQTTMKSLILLSFQGDEGFGAKYLPLKWSQRYGDSAKVASDLFRKAFDRYANGDLNRLEPTQKQRDAFRADSHVSAMGSLLKKYSDEFSKMSEQSENPLMKLREKYLDEYQYYEDKRVLEKDRLHKKHEAQRKYKPRKSWVQKWQEQKAFARTQKEYFQLKGQVFDPVFAFPEDKLIWRELYTKAFLSVLGLYPEFKEAPELEEEVVYKADQATQIEVGEHSIRSVYLSRLTPLQRIAEESTLYAMNYARSYSESVKYSSKLTPISPAQPGRLQWLRQKDVVRSNLGLTRFLRGLESLVPEDAYRPGLYAMINRNVPAFYDIVLAHERAIKGIPSSALASYWFQRGLWGIDLTAGQWALKRLALFSFYGPYQWLVRFFKFQGLKPMEDWRVLIAFQVAYSFATFVGEIPKQIFAGDFVSGFNMASKIVTPYLKSILSSAVIGAGMAYGYTKLKKTSKTIWQYFKQPKLCADLL